MAPPALRPAEPKRDKRSGTFRNAGNEPLDSLLVRHRRGDVAGDSLHRQSRCGKVHRRRKGGDTVARHPPRRRCRPSSVSAAGLDRWRSIAALAATNVRAKDSRGEKKPDGHAVFTVNMKPLVVGGDAPIGARLSAAPAMRADLLPRARAGGRHPPHHKPATRPRKCPPTGR